MERNGIPGAAGALTSSDLVLRAARDADSDAVIALIAAVFEEFDGCVLDVDLEEPELRAPASRFDRFWVLERGGDAIVGCVALAVRHRADGRAFGELKKLYLDRTLRGLGLGTRLIETVEAEARDLYLPTLELWSDTRFERAHEVYRRLGYVQTGERRHLGDLSGTIEEHFVKVL